VLGSILELEKRFTHNLQPTNLNLTVPQNQHALIALKNGKSLTFPFTDEDKTKRSNDKIITKIEIQ
jgi:hypothetical protein